MSTSSHLTTVGNRRGGSLARKGFHAMDQDEAPNDWGFVKDRAQPQTVDTRSAASAAQTWLGLLMVAWLVLEYAIPMLSEELAGANIFGSAGAVLKMPASAPTLPYVLEETTSTDHPAEETSSASSSPATEQNIETTAANSPATGTEIDVTT
eukprot:2282854-Pyramimonas_sp.AAC.1